MSKATTAPKCMVCGSNHWLRDPHKWTDIDTNKPTNVATSNKNVPTKRVHKPENVPTIQDTQDNVPTITRVSMRELNQGMAKHFAKLPFIVTKNGKDIARVIEV